MIVEQFTPVLTNTAEGESRLTAAVRLFEVLNQAGVRYCHWKSNVRLGLSLAGKTDLDLLVDPDHAGDFLKILAQHGFKPLADAPGKRYPGLEHHLGFDWETGRLIHLHVHFKLVLGEQHVKNYHLPLEGEFLNSVHLSSGVQLPAAELELIILSLRVLLKYRDRDGLKDLLSIRSPGLPAHILDELSWLMGEVSPVELESTLASLDEVLPVDAVRDFLRIVRENPRSGWALLLLRAQVRSGLRRYQRSGRLEAIAAYFAALWRKSRDGERQMGLPCNGRKIALVGVDGSGKSTLSRELAVWLNWKLDTHLLYLGSKQPSLRSRAYYWLFRIARRSQSEITRWFSADHALAHTFGRLKERLLAGHYLSIGMDRYRRYLRANRLAEGGSVVIFDRFPIESPLDGPEIGRLNGNLPPGLKRAAQREAGLYKRFQSLDRLILLEVPAEISAQRKPDHPLETIQAKDRALLELKSRLRRAALPWKWVSVDASLPLAEVLLAAKRAVWEAL